MRLVLLLLLCASPVGGEGSSSGAVGPMGLDLTTVSYCDDVNTSLAAVLAGRMANRVAGRVPSQTPADENANLLELSVDVEEFAVGASCSTRRASRSPSRAQERDFQLSFDISTNCGSCLMGVEDSV